MSPSVGRFTQQDSFGGIALAPATLNKYVYADADAANKRDPSGFTSMADLSAAQRTQNSLSASTVRNISKKSLDFVRKKKMYDIYSYVDMPLHFYMYAEKIGARAGYRYDVGNDLGWKSASALVNPVGTMPGGHIQVRPVITRNYLTGRGIKVSALTFGQWYLWHTTVIGRE